MSECAHHLTNIPDEGLTPPPLFTFEVTDIPPFPITRREVEGGTREPSTCTHLLGFLSLTYWHTVDYRMAPGTRHHTPQLPFFK